MRTYAMSGAIGIAVGLVFVGSMAMAQVFLPRQAPPQLGQPQPAPQPAPFPGQSGQMPAPSPPMPPSGGPPGPLTMTIPFVKILGDPTKSFIQLGNLRTAMDSNFILGRGLAGRIMLEKHIADIANGQKAYFHVNGVSGPPTVISEGNDLHLQFLFPVLQLKTYYQEYSGEGDTALGDLVAERVVVDIVLTPTIDQRMLPTYHSVRVAVSGVVKEADKCTYFFAVVFPLNICKAGAEYIAYIKTALENEIRESLLQPPTRMQFEQQVFQVVRTELLAKSGINPMSPAQVQIIQAEFRGTDYVVSYLIR
jgi:hypothetical protein